jgi:hypothetical protein
MHCALGVFGFILFLRLGFAGRAACRVPHAAYRMPRVACRVSRLLWRGCCGAGCGLLWCGCCGRVAVSRVAVAGLLCRVLLWRGLHVACCMLLWLAE